MNYAPDLWPLSRGLSSFCLGVDVDRYALLVDAGYFFAAGSSAAFGDAVERRRLRLTDPAKCITSLVREAEKLCDGAKILRTYWYDAVPGAELTAAQAELAVLPSLKLRLGVINGAGQQKGVDTLIVTDLVELARNRAISDAVVVSGDEDIRIAVSLAQSFGLRVHLLGAGNIARNMSRTLRHEADTVAVLPEEWLKDHLEFAPENSSVGQSVQPEARSRVCAGQPEPDVSRIQVDLEIISGEELSESARRVVASLIAQVDARRREQLQAQLESTGNIPSEFDRPLVGAVARLQGGRRLNAVEVGKARKIFREFVCVSPETR